MADISITPTIMSQWDDHKLSGTKQIVWLYASRLWMWDGSVGTLGGEHHVKYISSLGLRLYDTPVMVADFLSGGGIDWYLVLPTPRHSHPKALSSFLFSPRTMYVASTASVVFRFYYVGATSDVLVTGYGEGQPIRPTVTFDECCAVEYEGDRYVPSNIHNGGLVMANSMHYVFDDGVKSVDVCTVWAAPGHNFWFINSYGVPDRFNYIDHSEVMVDLSYDTVQVSDFVSSSYRYVNYNPQDESRTTFTTHVLKVADQAHFSEFVSSPCVCYGGTLLSPGHQVLIDKSSVSVSSKSKSYMFSVKGVL